MIDKINGHRFSLGVTIAIGTQVVAGLLYFNSLVTTLDQTAEQVEELTTLTQQLNGRLTRIEFDSQRNYCFFSTFGSLARTLESFFYIYYCNHLTNVLYMLYDSFRKEITE